MLRQPCSSPPWHGGVGPLVRPASSVITVPRSGQTRPLPLLYPPRIYPRQYYDQPEPSVTTRSKAPAALLPLTPVVLHILLALADGELHGYAIAQEVEALTDGKVRMGPGTLYGSIARMQATGLIEEPRRRAGDAGDERRRYYRLSGLGRRTLELETQRLADIVRLARSKKLLRGPAPA